MVALEDEQINLDHHSGYPVSRYYYCKGTTLPFNLPEEFMPFKVLDFVDATLVSQEGREPKASRTPSVWPSEASADRIDKTEGPIVGACHRKSFGRMVGWPITNQVDPIGAWRFVTGRSVEEHLTTLAMDTKPPIFAASGVRHYVKDIYLPFELDLVVKDPDIHRGWIVECKTIYGYFANKQIIQEGKPKLDNIMQIALYLLEIKNGKRLKEIIEAGFADRFAHEAKALAAGKEPTQTRNRIQANLERVAQIDDGCIGAKLIYISRDECQRKEFDITIQEDFDGSNYPCIDGMMWKVFTVESIYERFKTLQNYWFQARAEGERRLEAKGVVAPPTLSLVRGRGDQPADRDETRTDEEKKAEQDYLVRLERETAALPVQFWPPAEYQYQYSPDKIELLNQRQLIGKTRYNAWKAKKKGADRIGDWQCLYCPFKKMCVPLQRPNLAYQIYDMDEMLPVEFLTEK